MLPGNSRSEAANANLSERLIEIKLLTNKRWKLKGRPNSTQPWFPTVSEQWNNREGLLQHRGWAPAPGFRNQSCWGGADNLYLRVRADAGAAGLGTPLWELLPYSKNTPKRNSKTNLDLLDASELVLHIPIGHGDNPQLRSKIRMTACAEHFLKCVPQTLNRL